jgi:hypothetical protein
MNRTPALRTIDRKPRTGGRRQPPPGSRDFYVERAETCLAAAAQAPPGPARQLHEEECQLWLILARQREEIEGMLQRYLNAAEAA